MSDTDSSEGSDEEIDETQILEEVRNLSWFPSHHVTSGFPLVTTPFTFPFVVPQPVQLITRRSTSILWKEDGSTAMETIWMWLVIKFHALLVHVILRSDDQALCPDLRLGGRWSNTCGKFVVPSPSNTTLIRQRSFVWRRYHLHSRTGKLW